MSTEPCPECKVLTKVYADAGNRVHDPACPYYGPTQRLAALREAAEAVLKDFECDHANSEYGTCFDCRNTGVLITSHDEAELVAAIKNLLLIA